MDQDDFVIFGFTGAFGSGCTTCAKFFTEKFEDKKEEFIREKPSINQQIEDFYNRPVGSGIAPATKRTKKELTQLVIKRQRIKALQWIKGGKFYYISMTNILNGLLVKDCLASKKGERTENSAEEYDELKQRVIDVASQFSITAELVDDLLQKQTNLSKDHTKEILQYYDKISKFKEKLSNTYQSKQAEFVKLMQNVGNNLRRTGNALNKGEMKTSKHFSILSKESGDLIKALRKQQQRDLDQDSQTYFMIECFRNPMEIEYLRERYSKFFLFAIFAGEDERYRRLEKLYGLPPEECKEIDKIDQGGNPGTGPYDQNIKKCVNLADIAVNNSKQENGGHPELCQKLLGYFALVKNPGWIKPTDHERNMNLAYSMSLNSTCISRQVGAIIVNNDGYVVGAGWNDTDRHRLGCIYRLKSDVKNTNNLGFPLCSAENDSTFRKLILDDGKELDSSFCYKDEYAKLQAHLKWSQTKNPPTSTGEELGKFRRSLQECRALHAEENAILQVSRTGGVSLRGATLYTTTFPCELCAKKILQMGIKKIVYCEPYPKSVSQDVFFAEVIFNREFSHIKFIPFEGVKSPGFFRLFKPSMDIKDQQEIVGINQNQAIQS
ncbi:MAG: deaminase, partial [Desulfomonilaceae bacterium]